MIKTFTEYMVESRKTAMYPHDALSALSYLALGLNGEAGEVAEKIKKMIRDYDDLEEAIEERREVLMLELGDVLWYISQMCVELGVSFEEVATANIDKLRSRYARNKIKGSGDDR